MLRFKRRDTVPNEDIDLPIGRTTFIVSDIMQLVEHGLVNANGKIFDTHIITSIHYEFKKN